MNEDLEARLHKARRSLANARLSFEQGDHDFAVSRAYYAMFYAAEALLASRGLAFSKHSAVIGAIAREFVRTGELEPRHFEAIDFAFRERNVADYGYTESVPAATARRVLQDAEGFISEVETKLRG